MTGPAYPAAPYVNQLADNLLADAAPLQIHESVNPK
jgi:hypothetical protein